MHKIFTRIRVKNISKKKNHILIRISNFRLVKVKMIVQPCIDAIIDKLLS